MMLAQTSSSTDTDADGDAEQWNSALSFLMKDEIKVDSAAPEVPEVCLDVRSMNFRAEVLHPVFGPKLAIQRATFTVESVDTCTGKDMNLALYVVFSSPHRKNKTYVYTQDLLRKMKADTFEIAVEATQWLDPGSYGLQIQIRDIDSQVIKRET